MLTNENKTGLAKLIDDAKEWKNKLIEMLDGPAAKSAINAADNALEIYVPEEFWDEINEAIANALLKDYKGATKDLYELGGEILAKYYWNKPSV